MAIEGAISNRTNRKKALLIAAGEVLGRTSLEQANEDTWAIRRLLIEVFHYDSDDVTVMMTDEGVEDALWPTRDNIRDQLRKFVQGTSPGDHLFFYFSGHGGQRECSHRSESDGYDECIFSCSGKPITDNLLKKYLVGPLSAGCKLFALWDACHSNTILDLDHYKCNEPQSDGENDLLNPQQICRALVPLAEYSERHSCQVHTNRTSHRSSESPVGNMLVHKNILSIETTGDQLECTVVSDPSWPLSPEHAGCNGGCTLPQAEERTKHAHIVSLSACRDNEFAHDDMISRQSFTKFFIEYLRENHNATLRKLLVYMRRKVDEMTKRRSVEGSTDLSRSFQLPGYSSHFKLDLDEPVDL